jgi:hypothetical protein
VEALRHEYFVQGNFPGAMTCPLEGDLHDADVLKWVDSVGLIR